MFQLVVAAIAVIWILNTHICKHRSVRFITLTLILTCNFISYFLSHTLWIALFFLPIIIFWARCFVSKVVMFSLFFFVSLSLICFFFLFQIFVLHIQMKWKYNNFISLSHENTIQIRRKINKNEEKRNELVPKHLINTESRILYSFFYL